MKDIDKLCQRYTKIEEGQHIFQLMSWSAQSVDINPVEMVWMRLSKKPDKKELTCAVYQLNSCKEAEQNDP